MLTLPEGIFHKPAVLDRSQQETLLASIREIVRQSPLFVPVMPRTGKAMSVRMTNCGTLGWMTDKARGYRYEDRHPVTKEVWPPIPDQLLDIWREFAGYGKPPEACLVNFYAREAKMGLHVDSDERALDCPVVSVSLGDECLFRIGGTGRNDPTQSFRLCSGDVVVIGGKSRLAYHGVDRIYPGTSDLLKNEGRINLTLRRVNP